MEQALVIIFVRVLRALITRPRLRS
jgi:hypothetical protein